MTEHDLQQSYDAVPYQSVALPSTYPGHLYALATLLGMRPAAPQQCRVLEIGCADGGNLLAMAATLPHSTFYGIDLSQRQIDTARELRNTLGLQNVTLEQRDIQAIGADFGSFDYIIAYGIYSWVPPEVQQTLFEVIRRHLAPQGIALVSYNTYPGWHIRGMVRDMLVRHSRFFTTQQERIHQSRALLTFLTTATDQLVPHMPRLELYQQLLAQEHDVLRDRPDYYLVHEHLDAYNEPVYLTDFVERAAQHRLQYLVDSHLPSSLTATLPRPIAAQLEAIAPNQIALEQYLDFLTNRQFRETLLCRSEVPVARDLATHNLHGLQLASAAHVETGEDGVVRFRAPGGTLVTLRAPMIRHAIEHLITIWPQSISFEDLVRLARDGRSDIDAQGDIQRLGDALIHCLMYDIISLRGCVAPLATTAGERPRAAALARIQAQTEQSVASLIHAMVSVDPTGRFLLPLLDGRHTREELVILLDDAITRGTLIIEPGEAGVSPAERLDRSLQELARQALIEA